MGYDDRLLSGADPLYAPGMDQGRYWKAPARYVKAGYSVKRVKLDGSDLDKAAMCRALTRDMLAWFDGAGTGVSGGTWQWLIGRYKGDEFSPIHDVKANTRDDYLQRMRSLENTIGAESLADWDYPMVRRWEKGLRAEGRSVDFIKKRATMIRILLGYGVVIEDAESLRLSTIFSRCHFEAPKARESYMTRDQMRAIVGAADAVGWPHIGTGIYLQFETSLRITDVFGQWLTSANDAGGIRRKAKRWADGMTWDMFDADMGTVCDVSSKTGIAFEYDLTQFPDLWARLRAIPRGLGPVFVQRNGTPFTASNFNKLFRRLKVKAGVPAEVQLRDTRPGAITEAKAAGATVADIRDLAGHATSTTTDRYMRARQDGAARANKMRQEKAS